VATAGLLVGSGILATAASAAAVPLASARIRLRWPGLPSCRRLPRPPRLPQRQHGTVMQ